MTFYKGSTADVRFTPYAWHKMIYFFSKGNTEVSGWGITAEDDHSLIVDFRLVGQECSGATTEMTEQGLIDYALELDDDGISPANGMRYWCHSHPMESCQPSGTDMQQFRDFSEIYPWICMIIVGSSLKTYCRMHLSQGPGIDVELSVGVDWRYVPEAADTKQWDKLYKEHVAVQKPKVIGGFKNNRRKNRKKTQYEKNYEQINWHRDPIESEFLDDDFIGKDRWGSNNHNYVNTIDDFDAEEFGLSDDELEQCRKEAVMNKAMHEMTDEEFKIFCEEVESSR